MPIGDDDAADIFPPERRQTILDTARLQGRVDVRDLSSRFGVTTETVRRDLNQLESLGLLRRVHGGAVSIDRLHLVPAVSERAGRMLAEKRAIARVAIAQVPPSGAIIIDAGTTTARMADVFPADRDLTVVTSSLPIAESLVDFPRVDVLLLGGRLGSRTRATTDTWALQALSGIHVDVAFFATTGISSRHGLTTGNSADAAVKRAMISASSRRIVLADSSKIGVDHTFIFSSLDAMDQLITDSGADEDAVDRMRAAGIGVTVTPSRSDERDA